jgi:hypothetical protein
MPVTHFVNGLFFQVSAPQARLLMPGFRTPGDATRPEWIDRGKTYKPAATHEIESDYRTNGQANGQRGHERRRDSPALLESTEPET